MNVSNFLMVRENLLVAPDGIPFSSLEMNRAFGDLSVPMIKNLSVPMVNQDLEITVSFFMLNDSINNNNNNQLSTDFQ